VLARLSWSLDEAFEITANTPLDEIEEELRAMNIHPNALSSSDLDRILRANGEKSPVYAYVSDESLQHDGVERDIKELILKLRFLTRQQRYQEALGIAQLATRLAPNYWRALISYAGLLVLVGRVDEGDRIYQRMTVKFLNEPKALGAAVHGSAAVKEIKSRLNPTNDEIIELSNLYEKAVKLDGARANSRACLLITSLLAGRTDKGRKVLEDSLQCEGFFEAMHFELEERGGRKYASKMYNVMQALPIWFRDFLCNSQTAFGLESAT